MMCRMLMFASAQQMPNLLLALHYMESLSHIYIFHSSNVGHSKEPAERLKKLLDIKLPKVAIALVDLGVDSPTPQEVVSAVKRLVEEDTARSWLINITGGTKLYAMAGRDICRLIPQFIRCFYRELNGVWFELSYKDDGVFAKEIHVNEALANALEVDELIALQSPKSPGAGKSRRPRDLNVYEMLSRQTDQSHWSWQKMFSGVDIGLNSNGARFEQFFAALIGLICKNANIRISYEVRIGDMAVQETDILVNYCGTLYVFDLKLQLCNAVDLVPMKQFEEAALRRKEYGGAAAQWIMVRPGWVDAEDQRMSRLASALGVRLWCRPEMPMLIAHLTRLLKQAVLPDLGEVWACQPQPYFLNAGEYESPAELLDLDAAIRAQIDQSACNWLIAKRGSQTILLLPKPSDLDSARRWLEKKFPGCRVQSQFGGTRMEVKINWSQRKEMDTWVNSAFLWESVIPSAVACVERRCDAADVVPDLPRIAGALPAAGDKFEAIVLSHSAEGTNLRFGTHRAVIKPKNAELQPGDKRMILLQSLLRGVWVCQLLKRTL